MVLSYLFKSILAHQTKLLGCVGTRRSSLAFESWKLRDAKQRYSTHEKKIGGSSTLLADSKGVLIGYSLRGAD